MRSTAPPAVSGRQGRLGTFRDRVTPVLGNRRQDVDGQLIGVRVDHVVAQLKERGDPWRLNEAARPAAPPTT